MVPGRRSKKTASVARGPKHCGAYMAPGSDASQWTCVRCQFARKREDGDLAFPGRQPRTKRAPRAWPRRKVNHEARAALHEEQLMLAPRR
jgi:hypothetical protein